MTLVCLSRSHILFFYQWHTDCPLRNSFFLGFQSLWFGWVWFHPSPKSRDGHSLVQTNQHISSTWPNWSVQEWILDWIYVNHGEWIGLGQKLLQEILSSPIRDRENGKSGIAVIGISHFVTMRWKRLELSNIYQVEYENESSTTEVRVERCRETRLSVTLFELLDQAFFTFRILSYMNLLYIFLLLCKLLWVRFLVT